MWCPKSTPAIYILWSGVTSPERRPALRKPTIIQLARRVPLEKAFARSWTQADGTRRDVNVSVATQRLVLLLLATYADYDDARGYGARPPMSRLVAETGLNERTIRGSLKALQRQGLIDYTPGNGAVGRRGGWATVYELKLTPQLRAVPNPETVPPHQNHPETDISGGVNPAVQLSSVPPSRGHTPPPTALNRSSTSLVGNPHRKPSSVPTSEGLEVAASGAYMGAGSAVTDTAAAAVAAGKAMRAAAAARLASKPAVKRSKRPNSWVESATDAVLRAAQPHGEPRKASPEG